ncbi:ankyrin repeat-containing domain protein [Mycena leptocephala]|nr:ankyrin repeat-containing domain protein [Mycena leptocephala]
MEGETEIVKLLGSGADPNLQGGLYGTPLQAACYKGSLQIAQFLLENGADVNSQGGTYCTALQAVAGIYQYSLNTDFPLKVVSDIINLLLNYGADPNVQGGKSGSALKAASCKQEIVALLRARGATS